MLRTPAVAVLAILFVQVAAFAQPTDVRTIDGSGNNHSRDDWGQAGTKFLRQAPASYPDGYGDLMMSEETDPARENPRYVSNHVCVQEGVMPNSGQMSDMVWQWGQFIDHDITLTVSGPEFGDATMLVPQTDHDGMPAPDPQGMVMIPFSRSKFAVGTGVLGHPRSQVNDITAWIDASMVYGSDDDKAWELRQGVDGLLRIESNGLLPKKNGEWFAGDVRAAEQIGLTAMHTLFVREHNRLARLIKKKNRNWTDEQIYQLARKIVGAEVQIITYKEFLPALLGWRAPSPLGGWNYDKAANPTITTEFATALYRFGHSMLAPNLALINERGDTFGSVPLREAFFNVTYYDNNPALIDDVLRGLVYQSAQEVDAKVVEDVRSFLFGMGGVGMDLAALNIQRGRDHGLPDYNTVRTYYGLAKVKTFGEISKDPQVQASLAGMYHSVDNIDLWVGALCEDHLSGNCNVGQLLATAIREQFERLRDGDRFFWTRDEDLKTSTVRGIINLYGVRLSDIIKWNTNVRRLPFDVFHVYGQ